ncbi:MAG TPA: threo-3-hydroxy-L-aspartate ammonia-lyase [Burkholderiaceae bacterium]|nr:threo-3-hydroxy-L-aspartate ammonia-lyase [Burkholderiaceae bacterium]
MSLPVSYADIERARERLKGVAHRTPVVTSRTANTATGAQLFFKCENLQRMGAFKFRGAYNALAQFSPQQRKHGVVAFSSGNHAQAIALAARLLDIPATIVMPHDAPQMKIEATRGYGAQVIGYDRYKEDREAIGKRLAAERSLTLIPPFDHADVIAGQGTAAAELIEDAGALDLLLVCVGGGGLISGSAVAARHLAPDCRVIGVEPEAGDDVQRSFRAGRIVHIDVPKTIADGAQTQQPGVLTFATIQALVSDIVTVSDAALVRAMRFFAERMKLVVEPTGALAAAAVFESKVPVVGKRVGVIVSGGNIDPARYGQLLAGATD